MDNLSTNEKLFQQLFINYANQSPIFFVGKHRSFPVDVAFNQSSHRLLQHLQILRCRALLRRVAALEVLPRFIPLDHWRMVTSGQKQIIRIDFGGTVRHTSRYHFWKHDVISGRSSHHSDWTQTAAVSTTTIIYNNFYRCNVDRVLDMIDLTNTVWYSWNTI